MLLQQQFEESLRENVPLAPMTTLGIGGPACYYAEAETTTAISEGVRWAHSRSLPLFVLGGGSNLVVADGGLPGLVLRLSIRGIETRVDGDDVSVTAGAGEEWDPLVARCVGEEWAGFECLSGIPGRVGATPIQNVGAYGQEISETLVAVKAFDRATDVLVDLTATECEFGYRSSRFKTRDRGRFIITGVTYRLRAGGEPSVRYADLQRYLADRGTPRASIADVREAVLAIRHLKAMVIDARDPDSCSVGSFFVNPTVTQDEYKEIKRLATRSSDVRDLPAFPASDGLIKLSAAWLIERAGVKRGYIHGNVGTSTKHALAIINRGGGTAGEVVELKNLIQKRVLEEFGVALTPEPVFVGFDE